MIRLNAACVLGAALAACPAAAQEKPFDGPSVTVIAGGDVRVGIGKAKVGGLYGGQVGYDIQSGGAVFGVEGEVTGATGRDCRSYVATTPASTNRFCATPGRDLYAGVRVGALVGDSTMLYGKVGYTNARFRDRFTSTAAPATNYDVSGNADGLRVGSGVEKALASGMTLKAEYRYSRYDGVRSRHQGVVGLGFRF